jgi:hypothetical protein
MSSIRFRRRASLLLAALVLLAASGLVLQGCQRRCGVADTVSVLDSQADWHLIYRVSGAQDKMQFFELYKGKPAFDDCGAPAAQPASKQPIDTEEGWLKAVRLRGTQLEIIYTRNKGESIEPALAKLER